MKLEVMAKLFEERHSLKRQLKAAIMRTNAASEDLRLSKENEVQVTDALAEVETKIYKQVVIGDDDSEPTAKESGRIAALRITNMEDEK